MSKRQRIQVEHITPDQVNPYLDPEERHIRPVEHVDRDELLVRYPVGENPCLECGAPVPMPWARCSHECIRRGSERAVQALRESQAARKMPAIPVGHEDDIAKLEAQVAAMRRLGVTKWGDIELGSAPTEAKEETQHQLDPDMLEKRRRAAQHATAMSATGRLVPRLGDHD